MVMIKIIKAMRRYRLRLSWRKGNGEVGDLEEGLDDDVVFV